MPLPIIFKPPESDTDKVLELINNPVVHVLAIGQSNMQRGGGTPYAAAETDYEPKDQVQILNKDNEWVTYDLAVSGLSDYLGTAASGTNNVSTIPFHFAKELNRKTGSTVRITASARDGESLGFWGVNTAGTVLDTEAEGWQAILTALEHVPRLDFIIFHQGEQLSGRTQAQQLAGLKLLFNAIIATGKATNDTPIIAGDLYLTNTPGAYALYDLAADPTWPQFYLAEVPHLGGLDTFHFSNEQIRDVGYEYVRIFLKPTVKVREISGGNEFIGFFRGGYDTDNEQRYRLSLSATEAGYDYRACFRVELAQGLVGGRRIATSEFVVYLSGNGQVWTAHQVCGGGTNGLSVALTIDNTTSTTADVLIGFEGAAAGGAWWGMSLLRHRDFLSQHLDESIAIDLDVVSLASENAAPTYAEEVLADSPVAWWRLNESSGTNAADSSGEGHNATYVGGYTLSQVGAIAGDTAVLLNGSTGYLNAGDHNDFDVTTSFTLEFWCKPTTVSTGMWVIGKDTDTGRSFCFGISVAGKLSMLPNGTPLANGTTTLTVGVWQHCAVTYDGSVYRYYLNGVADGVQATGLAPPVTTSPLLLGRRGYPGFEEPYSGVLDEVAMYPTPLSAGRIAAHYAAGL